MILSACFADEEPDRSQTLIRDHVIGRLQLAPTQLLYVVANAILQARRRKRINEEQVEEVLSSSEGLVIALRPLTWQQMFSIALHLDRSAYDAAYLALAERSDQPLVTGELRMYNAVREHLDWVEWIGDFRTTG